MAILTVGEIWQGRDGDSDASVRNYTRVFRVTTDSPADDAVTVGSAAGLPLPGDAYPSDAGAYAQKSTVRNESFSKMVWIVTIAYSSARQRANDPKDDPPTYEWDTEQFQKPATIDRDGNGIVNSAGDPFDPPLEMDDSRRSVTIKANVLDIPAISSWLLDYQDAVNSDAITIDGLSVAAGKAKMQHVSIGPTTDSRNGYGFRAVSMTIHLRRDGWALQPLDAGFRKIDSAGGTGTSTSTGTGTGAGGRVNITNADGSAPPAPVLLDGAGDELLNPTSATAVYLSFDVYQERAFSGLPGIT